MLLLVQPVFAQRKYNKTSSDALQIYMVMVQGGEFDLGADDEAEDRRPAHTVKLADYYISPYEVTQFQWRTIMGSNPSYYECDQCPVTNVSWTDVQDFIKKLNETTGKNYRLPTEAEWEYAARGGVNEVLVKKRSGVARGGVNEFMIWDSEKGRRVPDKMKRGDRFAGQQRAGEVAWYSRNSEEHIHRIGLKKPNSLGLYDMSGNVEEWCADWYASSYGSRNTVENPKGPSSGNAHVVRGGSYQNAAHEVGVTRRAGYVTNTKAISLGFRLARDK